MGNVISYCKHHFTHFNKSTGVKSCMLCGKKIDLDIKFKFLD